MSSRENTARSIPLVILWPIKKKKKRRGPCVRIYILWVTHVGLCLHLSLSINSVSQLVSVFQSDTFFFSVALSCLHGRKSAQSHSESLSLNVSFSRHVSPLAHGPRAGHRPRAGHGTPHIVESSCSPSAALTFLLVLWMNSEGSDSRIMKAL